jgi:hypothetical protein
MLFVSGKSLTNSLNNGRECGPLLEQSDTGYTSRTGLNTIRDPIQHNTAESENGKWLHRSNNLAQTIQTDRVAIG